MSQDDTDHPTRKPVALVTGASSGIGRATAVALANDGYVVHALGRREQPLRELAADVAGIIPVIVDLTSLDFEGVVPAEVSVVVHAAGVADSLRVAEATADDWHRHLVTNVISGAELIRLALPALRRSRGIVVLVNSGAGLRSFAGNTVYSASKFALTALADGLRLEEDEAGVRVTSVHPGPTDTPLYRAGGSAPREALIRPETVAAAILSAVKAPADAQLTQINVRPRVEINR